MDGADLQTEYEYDENGNLTKDLNKNISRITYNLLNLPKEIMMICIMNKILLFLFMAFFTGMGAYCNDSILVNKEWTERITIFVNETSLDSIGENPIIENNGIKCGYDGCKKIFFLSDHRFKYVKPNGDVHLGTWTVKDNFLTIRFKKRVKGHKKCNIFMIKYKQKEYPTLYLFAKNRFVCYVFCNYKSGFGDSLLGNQKK
ncbi:MAG: hypothetical protein J5965_06225 [Aeriscardovia sp.]|nr:hypothetical protein [Aeriscardovia sp.]MBP3230003.1 hypothetical protein [Prevotella sp.]